MIQIFFIIFALINQSFQDIYLHNPRGSNNRLNENTDTRTTNNRLFDSQNNNRGGYNVGDAADQAATNANSQYQMRYFQSGVSGSSYLKIEYTQQHGCGGRSTVDTLKTNCVNVLQYMCQDANTDSNDLNLLRDGINTNQQDYSNANANVNLNNMDDYNKAKNNDVKIERGLHETWDWYKSCSSRNRNSNLFHADQNLQKTDARSTRQNNQGNRNGYECPEERDYYPYWHPSPWKDIAILTTNTELCDNLYIKQSFNVKPYHECVHLFNTRTRIRKLGSKSNNAAACKKENGEWTEFYNYLEIAPKYNSQGDCEKNKDHKWAIPSGALEIKSVCLVLLPKPECKQASLLRSNHLGNSENGETTGYSWKLPHFPSKNPKRCVFRIRYNISTNDYNPQKTDSKSDKDKSPIKNNPNVAIDDKSNTELKLAVNTAQFGRVFQDRSHVFYLLPRINSINDSSNLYNLNIRGKRGNIVQTYPAVEYDFVPNNLEINPGDLVHIQWTGSNTHNNKEKGDGQGGDDGQGNAGTDRTNLLQIHDLNQNYPLPFEKTNMWNDMQVVGVLNSELKATIVNSYFLPGNFGSKDLALLFSTSSYFQCISQTTCNKSYEKYQLENNIIDIDLNKAPASNAGAIVSFKENNKIYNYMCTRNNAFSNRSQKGSLMVGVRMKKDRHKGNRQASSRGKSLTSRSYFWYYYLGITVIFSKI